MGQALYRKYRPKKLDDVSGQKHIVTVLNNAIKTGKISHAYLFTGPRGVGKTSVARILAHEINNLAYNETDNHIDIIEIDAASNRRIDEIRDLREKVNISPAQAKYKVYIIDEVHMLTKEAFNALLKTLEEPPAHAVFILATTDAHKVPDTIISRTQQFNFKPIEISEMANELVNIAKKENIKIDRVIAERIAAHGQGSFRDSLSLLDQLNGYSKSEILNENAINQLIGRPDDGLIKSLILLTLDLAPAKEIMVQLDSIYQSGAVANEIAKSMSQSIRSQIYKNEVEADSQIIELLEGLMLTQSANLAESHLEITIFRYISSKNGQANKKHIEHQDNDVSVKHEPVQKDEKVDVIDESDGIFNNKHWQNVLENLKTKHNTLYGVMRMAEPRFSDDKLVLAFEFSFHQKRASEKANYQKLATIIQDVSGKSIDIEAIVDKNNKKNKIAHEPAPKQNDRSIENISNIFKGAELLES